MNQKSLFHGHVSAPADYYEKAIQHIREQFVNRPLVFFVVADDLHWARKYLAPFASRAGKRRRSRREDESKRKSAFLGEIQFTESGYREVDMCIIATCDATIISTGTFSWWSAFLADASTTVYFGKWPLHGTVLSIMVERAKFFLPSWTPLF